MGTKQSETKRSKIWTWTATFAPTHSAQWIINVEIHLGQHSGRLSFNQYSYGSFWTDYSTGSSYIDALDVLKTICCLKQWKELVLWTPIILQLLLKHKTSKQPLSFPMRWGPPIWLPEGMLHYAGPFAVNHLGGTVDATAPILVPTTSVFPASSSPEADPAQLSGGFSP